ncbi:MAG: hypothetical protein WCK03_02475, partial [Candidatus Taylorbacteria bacterium]
MDNKKDIKIVGGYGHIDEKIGAKFLKPYDSVATEDKIYTLWEKSGYFNPDNLPERNKNGEPF